MAKYYLYHQNDEFCVFKFWPWFPEPAVKAEFVMDSKYLNSNTIWITQDNEFRNETKPEHILVCHQIKGQLRMHITLTNEMQDTLKSVGRSPDTK